MTAYAKWTSSELILNNGLVERKITLPAPTGGFLTKSYQPVTGEFKYFLPTNTDFQFEINGTPYSGNSNWDLVRIEAISDSQGGNGALVRLSSDDKKIEVMVRFLLYPNLPVIRKSLVIKNVSDAVIVLESVDVEKFQVTNYHASTFSWIFSNYGRRRSIGPFEGGMQDALVIVHHPDWEAGIVIGNEAAGVMKRTAVLGWSHDFQRTDPQGRAFSIPQMDQTRRVV